MISPRNRHRRCTLPLVAAAILTLALAPTAADAQDGTDPDPPSADPPRGRHVDLPEAISLAMTRSLQIKQQQVESHKAAIRIDEAFWGWTPKLELNLTVAPFPEVSGDGDTATQDADILSEATGVGIYTKNSLEFVMPIFTSTKLSTAEDLAQIGLDVERLRVDEQRSRVEWDVTRAWYALQLAVAIDGVLDEASGVMRRVDDGWRELHDSGSDKVERTDEYKIDIAQAQLEALTLQAEQGRSLAAEALRVHTNIDGTITVPEMRYKIDQLELLPLEDVLAIARDTRWELAQLVKAVEAAETAAHLEWLYWWPDFYVAGGISLAFNNAVPESTRFYDNDPYNSFGVGILAGMRWKLDPVNRAFKVEQADTAAERVRIQQQLAIKGVELQVKEAWHQAITKQKLVDIARASRRAAKRIMTQELLDYEAGGGDVKDVIDAVSQYFQTRSLFLVALHDFRVQLAKLRLQTSAASVDDLLAAGSLADYVSEEEALDAQAEDAE